MTEEVTNLEPVHKINGKFFMEIATIAVEHFGGKLRLAHKECDDSTNKDEDAVHHFLKLSEKRLGRDLRSYGSLSKPGNESSGLIKFVEEILYPIRSCGLTESYKQASKKLMENTLQFFEENEKPVWQEILS